MRYALETICVMVLLVIAGCDDKQSAFSALGPVSGRITFLIWIMFIGAALITVLICALMLISIAGPAHWRHKLTGEKSLFGEESLSDSDLSVCCLWILVLKAVDLGRAENRAFAGSRTWCGRNYRPRWHPPKRMNADPEAADESSITAWTQV